MDTNVQEIRKREYQRLFDEFVSKHHRQPSVQWVRKTSKQVNLKFPEPIITPTGFVDDDDMQYCEGCGRLVNQSEIHASSFPDGGNVCVNCYENELSSLGADEQ